MKLFFIIFFLILFCSFLNGNDKEIFPEDVKIKKIYCKDITWGGGASKYKIEKYQSESWPTWSRFYDCIFSNGTKVGIEASAVKRKIETENNILPTGAMNFIKLKSCVAYCSIVSAEKGVMRDKQNVEDYNSLLRFFADFIKKHPFCL